MRSIFINYRTADKQYALWIYPWLIKRFGRESVFWDRKGIDPGLDFGDVIEEAVRASKALIALITKDWLSAADESGGRKIDSPQDWVRREIAIALDAGIQIIPVLASGVNMPGAGELPGELAKLVRLQAIRMTDIRFHDLLLEAIEKVVPAPEVLSTSGGVQVAPDRNIQRRAATLLRSQVARLQVRAVELIEDRKLDRAEEELAEGSELLMALLDLLPGDITMDLQLGYLFKTVAQSFHEANDHVQAGRYLELALSVFERVKSDPEAREGSLTDLAGAINGIGNTYSLRGDLEQALQAHRLATELVPGYAFAWHDLFGVHDMLARRGSVDVDAMRHALERLKETGASWPGLGKAKFADFEERLRHWEGVVQPDAFRRRGLIRLLKNDYPAAEADFSDAIELAKSGADTYADIYFERGTARAAQGKDKQAEEDFLAAIARGRDDASVHNELGKIRLGRGDSAGAEDAFSRNADPGPSSRFALGLAFLLAGRFEQARAAYALGLPEASPEEIDTALREIDEWSVQRGDRAGLLEEAAKIRSQLAGDTTRGPG